MSDETPKNPTRTVQVTDAAKAKVATLQREYRLKFGEEISKIAVVEAAIAAANVDDMPAPVLDKVPAQAA